MAGRRVVWIGGSQWAGKSSVARVLAMRHGLIPYVYDYHDARSHLTRAVSEPHRFPHRAETARRLADPDFYESWVTSSPHELAEQARREHVERFAMVVDDLAGLSGDGPVVRSTSPPSPTSSTPSSDRSWTDPGRTSAG